MLGLETSLAGLGCLTGERETRDDSALHDEKMQGGTQTSPDRSTLAFRQPWPGLDAAVRWHGGEANAAREAFRTADLADREALIAFLMTL